MAFYENSKKFNGQFVADFHAEKGILNPDIAYRIRTDSESESAAKILLKQFLEDPKIPLVSNFVLGVWSAEVFEIDPSDFIETILNFKDRLQHIKGIFFGDIEVTESELSWINQTNHGPLLTALPNLEVYKIRGAQDLSLGKLNHQNLKTLIIESAGTSNNIFEELGRANLPNLTHLELWLGSEDQGFEATTTNQIFQAFQNMPSLIHLGLNNSENTNEIAIALTDHPIMQQIKSLDLSGGILGDKGASALLNNPNLTNLNHLNLSHNYMSDELAAQFEQLDIDINLSTRYPAVEEGDRYIAVGE